jgi:FkbM family methyltransferase
MLRRLRSTRAYEWHTVHRPSLSADSVVLDLGANSGRFARAIVEDLGCRCLAVEPSPETFERIPQSDRIARFRLAISERPGTLEFNVHRHSLSSSLLAVSPEDATDRIRVEAIDLTGFIREHARGQVDLIKMDIEGAEVAVLDSLSDDLLRGIKQLSVEFHDFCGITPESEVARIARRLQGLGFYYLRMSGVGHQDTLFVNRALVGMNDLEYTWIKSVVRNYRGAGRVLQRQLTRVGLRWA